MAPSRASSTIALRCGVTPWWIEASGGGAADALSSGQPCSGETESDPLLVSVDRQLGFEQRSRVESDAQLGFVKLDAFDPARRQLTEQRGGRQRRRLADDLVHLAWVGLDGHPREAVTIEQQRAEAFGDCAFDILCADPPRGLLGR